MAELKGRETAVVNEAEFVSLYETPLTVPEDRATRDLLRAGVRSHVEERHLVPPLSMEEMESHARMVVARCGANPCYASFALVLVGNEVWRDTVASVPYERRILLLPQCLRTKSKCPADQDELGLLCEQCGRCPTGKLQAEAERLGYAVLIAEGTTVVTKLLEQGKIDAVLGVSCLPTLERSFPYLAADAIPGIAIPLHRAGCDSALVDLDEVYAMIRLKSDTGWATRMDLDRLREEVRGWFDVGALKQTLGADGTRTEKIALSWLCVDGKRWRPFLAACVHQALTDIGADVPETMQRLSIAVECFHKASLVHDDIEDDDDTRYGEETLHRRHGVPIALNTGDFLLGQGYRLIASCGASDEQIARMLAVAATGHRTLSLGQGEELCWMRETSPLSPEQVIEIFRRKTAPAFEVALQLGAIAADADGETCRVLEAFSEALGIAYQIRDDLNDFHGKDSDGDLNARRLSLLVALASRQGSQQERHRFARTWTDAAESDPVAGSLESIVDWRPAEEKARQLLEHYKNKAIRSLSPLRNAHLKSLLRRIVGRILGRP